MHDVIRNSNNIDWELLLVLKNILPVDTIEVF